MVSKKEDPKKQNEKTEECCPYDPCQPEVVKKLNGLKPFLYTGLFAWPAYWLYKGLMWHGQRKKHSLPFYIKRTYYEAKLVQVALMTVGIAAVLLKKDVDEAVDKANKNAKDAKDKIKKEVKENVKKDVKEKKD